eukprot:TRINITY_DN11804_c0_g1_i1.p1 TRINITY_DN11804_c0_g1~~TRINITY_DN11804_c0_g1_i1.p1  ORF type:complete len:202 (+),score=48.57 TRINITY_DN11804_c0_g1_i1:169-774(+)
MEMEMEIDLTGYPGYQEKKPTWKEKIWDILEGGGPSNTKVTMAMFTVIFLSVVVYAMQSLPQYYTQEPRKPATFYYLEAICVSIFTFELTAKFVTAPNNSIFIRNPYNWIDFISIIPFYIDLAVTSFGSSSGSVRLIFLRVVRLARIFRVLKLGRYNKSLKMVLSVLGQSVDAFFLLIFMLFISVVLFSSLMYVKGGRKEE